MGNDMLKETGKKLKLEEKKLAQDIKTALNLHISISGNKKALLQSQHDQLQTNFFDNVKLTGKDFNYKIKVSLTDFRSKWQSISEVLEINGDLITSERVGSIDLMSYHEALASISNTNEKRIIAIDAIEKELNDIEELRAVILTNQATELSEKLKALNYQPPSSVDRLVQTECSQMNKIILDNRQAITHYLVALRAFTFDCSENLKTYHDEYAVNWNQARYKFTFNAYSVKIQETLDVNLGIIFDKYSKIFQNAVGMLETAVFN
jgi:hypothetical protein